MIGFFFTGLLFILKWASILFVPPLIFTFLYRYVMKDADKDSFDETYVAIVTPWSSPCRAVSS